MILLAVRDAELPSPLKYLDCLHMCGQDLGEHAGFIFPLVIRVGLN